MSEVGSTPMTNLLGFIERFGNMKLEEQNRLCEAFRTECKIITDTKGKDYSPDGIAFAEIKETAKELDIRPEQVLYVHLKKHLSAVKAYMKHGKAASEPIEERLKDLANYCALLYTLLQESK